MATHWRHRGGLAPSPPTAWPYLLACAVALVGFLLAGPLQAAPSHGTGPRPTASAAHAGSDDERTLRRCHEHPVRAVRDECLAQARRQRAAAASSPASR